ncbi:pilus assembly protein PilZ [Marimonas sp. MJW-29]|uniref:Pilus assembly protein PilZ n=1 Tax=Sulfitobacter sediminis TaxID=3234186 RepID=A0ABV3RSY6_9RHOB
MSTSDKQEPTPAHVAEKATQSARLPALALIGIFGSENALNALIREKNGTIQRVAVGDRISGQTIAAIGEDRVVLGNGNTLKLPQG